MIREQLELDVIQEQIIHERGLWKGWDENTKQKLVIQFSKLIQNKIKNNNVIGDKP